jgi:hypothetical protein
MKVSCNGGRDGVRCVSSEQNWDNNNVVRLERAAAKLLTLVSLRYNNEGNSGHSIMIDKDSVDKVGDLS